jgi:hypothetical protein
LHDILENIASPVVWHDPWDTSFGCSSDEFAFGVRGCCDAEGDQEDILSAEGGDESGVVVVGGFGYFDARWELAGALRASDGGDVETAALEEGFGHVASASSAGLGRIVSLKIRWLDLRLALTPTMAMFLM